MPRYLHIPHTPDTAQTQTLSGRNCLVVSGIVTPPQAVREPRFQRLFSLFLSDFRAI